MGRYYDITYSDASYCWLNSVTLKKGHLIEKYCIECNNDFEISMKCFTRSNWNYEDISIQEFLSHAYQMAIKLDAIRSV